MQGGSGSGGMQGMDMKNVNMREVMDMSSSEEEITIDFIIENRPKTSIVREFFRYNMGSILSEEEKMFTQG